MSCGENNSNNMNYETLIQQLQASGSAIIAAQLKKTFSDGQETLNVSMSNKDSSRAGSGSTTKDYIDFIDKSINELSSLKQLFQAIPNLSLGSPTSTELEHAPVKPEVTGSPLQPPKLTRSCADDVQTLVLEPKPTPPIQKFATPQATVKKSSEAELFCAAFFKAFESNPNAIIALVSEFLEEKIKKDPILALMKIEDPNNKFLKNLGAVFCVPYKDRTKDNVTIGYNNLYNFTMQLRQQYFGKPTENDDLVHRYDYRNALFKHFNTNRHGVKPSQVYAAFGLCDPECKEFYTLEEADPFNDEE